MQMLRLALHWCASYALLGTAGAEDVMTASMSSRTQQVRAVNISELDTKLVTATQKTVTLLAWHDLKRQAQYVHAGTHHIRYNNNSGGSM